MLKLRTLKLGLSVAVVGMLVAVYSNAADTTNKSKVAESVKPKYAAEDIGLRNTSVYDETKTVSNKTNYRTDVPGSGNKIKRAYQDAPPMIPHDVEGMMEITRDNNQCISCHIPAVAESMGATPIPDSHFMDFRPRHQLVNGEFKKVADNMKNEVSIKKLDDLASARFNCAACHAPQSQGDAPLNVFEPDFIDKDGTAKSNWTGDRLLEGLNTVAY
ncbi:nitrate reductase cytochrome c-type subunit [Arcobacter sp. FWKO B]|uniref:nitrate reductase cytochrome c-type subunit n=1 Tax=Arcobacter sp. FWKO B TaxID=2593672 RepID=UPI001D1989D4|nr:nitrate reductase cytochrome c-type subunit [Arcobacter sp. FWKO B]